VLKREAEEEYAHAKKIARALGAADAIRLRESKPGEGYAEFVAVELG
jgi:hypothetical protein